MGNASIDKLFIIERRIMGFSAYFSILSPTGWSLFTTDAIRFSEETAFKLQELFSRTPSFFSYIVLSFPEVSNESE